MYNVKLTRSKTFDSKILMHSCTENNDVSLAKKFQKHMSKDHCKYRVTDEGKYRKYPVKENGHTESIMFRIMMMFHTKK